LATSSGRRYIPERGDVVWLSFDPQAGHEQAGRRPAVVLSPSAYNQSSGLALVVPITSHRKGYPFEVQLPSGARVSGVILADHVRSVDWEARKAEHISVLSEATLKETLRKAALLITPG
jgi:mRNA interferase MazF